MDTKPVPVPAPVLAPPAAIAKFQALKETLEGHLVTAESSRTTPDGRMFKLVPDFDWLPIFEDAIDVAEEVIASLKPVTVAGSPEAIPLAKVRVLRARL